MSEVNTVGNSICVNWIMFKSGFVCFVELWISCSSILNNWNIQTSKNLVFNYDPKDWNRMQIHTHNNCLDVCLEFLENYFFNII